MCIFNDLSGGNNYPSLLVRFNDGRDRVVKNVSYFAVHGDTVRASVCNRKKDVELKNVAYVTITHYKYKVVGGKATTQFISTKQ